MQDVAPEDYRKANREGFIDKIDEIRALAFITWPPRTV